MFALLLLFGGEEKRTTHAIGVNTNSSTEERRDFIQNIDIARPSSSSLPLTTPRSFEKKAPTTTTTPKHYTRSGPRKREGKGFFIVSIEENKDDAHLVHVDSLLRFGLDGDDKTSRLGVGSRLMMITTQRSVRIRRRDRVPRGNTASIHRAR